VAINPRHDRPIWGRSLIPCWMRATALLPWGMATRLPHSSISPLNLFRCSSVPFQERIVIIPMPLMLTAKIFPALTIPSYLQYIHSSQTNRYRQSQPENLKLHRNHTETSKVWKSHNYP
jgi:hypothetical protein